MCIYKYIQSWKPHFVLIIDRGIQTPQAQCIINFKVSLTAAVTAAHRISWRNPSRDKQSQLECGRTQEAAAALFPGLSTGRAQHLLQDSSVTELAPPASAPLCSHHSPVLGELPAQRQISVWEGIEGTFNVHFIYLQTKIVFFYSCLSIF